MVLNPYKRLPIYTEKNIGLYKGKKRQGKKIIILVDPSRLPVVSAKTRAPNRPGAVANSGPTSGESLLMQGFHFRQLMIDLLDFVVHIGVLLLGFGSGHFSVFNSLPNSVS